MIIYVFCLFIISLVISAIFFLKRSKKHNNLSSELYVSNQKKQIPYFKDSYNRSEHPKYKNHLP